MESAFSGRAPDTIDANGLKGLSEMRRRKSNRLASGLETSTQRDVLRTIMELKPRGSDVFRASRTMIMDRTGKSSSTLRRSLEALTSPSRAGLIAALSPSRGGPNAADTWQIDTERLDILADAYWVTHNCLRAGLARATKKAGLSTAPMTPANTIRLLQRWKEALALENHHRQAELLQELLERLRKHYATWPQMTNTGTFTAKLPDGREHAVPTIPANLLAAYFSHHRKGRVKLDRALRNCNVVEMGKLLIIAAPDDEAADTVAHLIERDLDQFCGPLVRWHDFEITAERLSKVIEREMYSFRNKDRGKGRSRRRLPAANDDNPDHRGEASRVLSEGDACAGPRSALLVSNQTSSKKAHDRPARLHDAARRHDQSARADAVEQGAKLLDGMRDIRRLSEEALAGLANDNERLSPAGPTAGSPARSIGSAAIADPLDDELYIAQLRLLCDQQDLDAQMRITCNEMLDAIEAFSTMLGEARVASESTPSYGPWPKLMTADIAAHYCGFRGVTAPERFRAVVRRGLYPAPIKRPGEQLKWRMEDLDKAIANLNSPVADDDIHFE